MIGELEAREIRMARQAALVKMLRNPVTFWLIRNKEEAIEQGTAEANFAERFDDTNLVQYDPMNRCVVSQGANKLPPWELANDWQGLIRVQYVGLRNSQPDDFAYAMFDCAYASFPELSNAWPLIWIAANNRFQMRITNIDDSPRIAAIQFAVGEWFADFGD